jgi:hypothetical protein
MTGKSGPRRGSDSTVILRSGAARTGAKPYEQHQMAFDLTKRFEHDAAITRTGFVGLRARSVQTRAARSPSAAARCPQAIA